MTGRWVAEFYEDSNGRRPVEVWLDGLSETKYAAMSAAISHLLERDGIGLAGGSWLKPIGGGLHEFRVRHNAAEIVGMFAAIGESIPEVDANAKVLLRLFVHFHGQRVILLVQGYDKGGVTRARDVNRPKSSGRARRSSHGNSPRIGASRPPSGHPRRMERRRSENHACGFGRAPLTIWVSTHKLSLGNREESRDLRMVKTFAQYDAERRARLSPAGIAAVRVFDEAYSFGAMFAQARRERGLKQRELADLCGIAQADISRIERGLIAPTTPTLMRLAEALNARITLELLPAPSSA